MAGTSGGQKNMTRDKAFAAWLRKPGMCKTVVYHKGKLPPTLIDLGLDRLALIALEAATGRYHVGPTSGQR